MMRDKAAVRPRPDILHEYGWRKNRTVLIFLREPPANSEYMRPQLEEIRDFAMAVSKYCKYLGDETSVCF